MSSTEQLFEAALALPEGERVALVEALRGKAKKAYRRRQRRKRR